MKVDIRLSNVIWIDCFPRFVAARPLPGHWSVDQAVDDRVSYMNAFWTELASQ